MSYIKKLVMYGFKSFPKKTELPFDREINVILGPNGSGKSNISDAICFVLGRLSIKSMRATKATKLIFLGTKIASPSKEAMVEIVFDNSDKTFTIDSEEVSIKRIVRKNGQSIYKINDKVNTRQEILFLLAQAGIDPNGFNIVLQGEIQNFVKMHTEERRKVIEEVSGISIYESKKEKSLKELEKTENKIKEISSILRERTSYLNNLEKEREQALKYKKLEKNLKIFKASIINFDLIKKNKEEKKIKEDIERKIKDIGKIKKLILDIKSNIENSESEISLINSTIQKSTGLDQERLNREISDFRAEIMGINVRIENYEKKILEISKEKLDIEDNIEKNNISIKELEKESPKGQEKKTKQELEMRKQELEKLEEERKKFYITKSELKSLKERIQDKKNILMNYTNESEFLLRQIETLSRELFDKRSDINKLKELKTTLTEKREHLENLTREEIKFEKISSNAEYEIKNQNKIKKDISEIDICPLCKTKITQEYINSIDQESISKINSLEKEIELADKGLIEIYKKRDTLKLDIEYLSKEISKRESDLTKISGINEKKYQIKNLNDKIKDSKEELLILEKKIKTLEKNFDENSDIEYKYETLKIEVQELSSRNIENVSSDISFKQRDIERSKISLKQLLRNNEDFNEELLNLKNNLKGKEKILEEKKKQEEELSIKSKKLISKRDDFHKKTKELESELLIKQNNFHNTEQEMNNFKIEKARIDAEVENLEIEMLNFNGIEVIKTNRESLVQKVEKTQEILSKIGSVNLRSLEVYDEIKKEYDEIKNKIEIISKEKEGIMRIIHEIDIKKKKTFLKTLHELNDIFSENFSQISSKGQVFLELENKKNPFEPGSGVQIILKTGHGKYFDINSLSGGEQTMVALSLIFAIQELKPYCFYVLDEIDAALDKRNAEKISELLKKYMKKGQYIIITHNDHVISSASSLYGVSMHDGVSKIISMKI